jgi:hypothetical protein
LVRTVAGRLSPGIEKAIADKRQAMLAKIDSLLLGAGLRSGGAVGDGSGGYDVVFTYKSGVDPGHHTFATLAEAKAFAAEYARGVYSLQDGTLTSINIVPLSKESDGKAVGGKDEASSSRKSDDKATAQKASPSPKDAGGADRRSDFLSLSKTDNPGMKPPTGAAASTREGSSASRSSGLWTKVGGTILDAVNEGVKHTKEALEKKLGTLRARKAIIDSFRKEIQQFVGGAVRSGRLTEKEGAATLRRLLRDPDAAIKRIATDLASVERSISRVEKGLGWLQWATRVVSGLEVYKKVEEAQGGRAKAVAFLSESVAQMTTFKLGEKVLSPFLSRQAVRLGLTLGFASPLGIPAEVALAVGVALIGEPVGEFVKKLVEGALDSRPVRMAEGQLKKLFQDDNRSSSPSP